MQMVAPVIWRIGKKKKERKRTVKLQTYADSLCPQWPRCLLRPSVFQLVCPFESKPICDIVENGKNVVGHGFGG